MQGGETLDFLLPPEEDEEEAQCVGCADCKSPQLVNDVCCKIALGVELEGEAAKSVEMESTNRIAPKAKIAVSVVQAMGVHLTLVFHRMKPVQSRAVSRTLKRAIQLPRRRELHLQPRIPQQQLGQ